MRCLSLKISISWPVWAYLPSANPFIWSTTCLLRFLRGSSETVITLNWYPVPAGVPQGTKLRPWLFDHF